MRHPCWLGYFASLSAVLGFGCADDSQTRGSGGSADSSEATGESGSSETSPTGSESESETSDEPPPDPICPVPLSEAIRGTAITADLLALDAIAAEHAGNRAAGTPGYEASAAYVEAQLQDAGYATTRWPFSFDRYVLTGPPQLARLGEPPSEYVSELDYATATWSPAGNVSAAIEAVDLELGLANQATSGCEPEDFAGFSPGNIALVQRGNCTFASKAANAEAAGAVAVLLFNQGDTDARLGLFSGSLGSQNSLSIPVLFATYAIGLELAEAVALDSVIVELGVDADIVATETFNVLAETRDGDPDHVIMLGAHLDSVPAGPGVNDNGSGTATVLEIAREFAACSPINKVRFAWWGAEEWGLHGSTQWVEALSDDELARVALYLNFDMLASPNYIREVHSGVNGPDGSTLVHDVFVEWFDAQALATVPTAFAGNSDYQAFVDAGVPSGGLATGAGSAKTQAQAELFGGLAGEAYDACYHQACDDQTNFDDEVLDHNARAAGHALETWATALGQLGLAPDIVSVADVLRPVAETGCDLVHE